MRHCYCGKGGPTPFVPGPGVCRVCWLYAAGLLGEHEPPVRPPAVAFAPPPGAHVLHFSGMDSISGTDRDAHARRLALMREFVPGPRTPCAHLGGPVPGAQADRLGLSVLREWHPCAKGHGEQGHVCKCDVANTCGACPDYRPGPTP